MSTVGNEPTTFGFATPMLHRLRGQVGNRLSTMLKIFSACVRWGTSSKKIDLHSNPRSLHFRSNLDGRVCICCSRGSSFAWVKRSSRSCPLDKWSEFLQVPTWSPWRRFVRIPKNDAGKSGESSQVLRYQRGTIGIVSCSLYCQLCSRRICTLYPVRRTRHCGRHFVFVYVLFPASMPEWVGRISRGIPGWNDNKSRRLRYWLAVVGTVVSNTENVYYCSCMFLKLLCIRNN